MKKIFMVFTACRFTIHIIMNHSVYELRSFYKSKTGRLTRRLVARHIRDIWPDLKDMRVMGQGYAVPYLRTYMNDAERVFSVMPERLGVHHWPEDGPNKTCISEDNLLPFESESIDRVLLIHGFEYAEQPESCLHEIWRVLKSNGRLLVVVPNRMGLWARAEWTPFGHGTPFTLGQVQQWLHKNYFVPERVERALFMPPFRSSFILHSAYRIENFGRYVMPGLAGLHMIEVSKKLYGGHLLREKERGRRRIFVPDAVPT